MNCGYKKQFYYAKRAQLDYEAKLSESRTGVALNKEEFYRMDAIVSSAIQKGQHLNHIIASNELSASRASIYRYLEKGYLSTKPIDFPRVVKFRKRRTRNLQPIPKTAKEGRSYEDFLHLLTEEEITYWLEMDTVTERNGGKVLLTFNLSFCKFIFARLLEKNHTMIRDILPKRTSFDHLTQDDINLVCSHVNSVKRASLNGKSTYELFDFTFGEDLASLLGITKIDPKNVIQSPRLLNK